MFGTFTKKCTRNYTAAYTNTMSCSLGIMFRTMPYHGILNWNNAQNNAIPGHSLVIQTGNNVQNNANPGHTDRE